MKLREIFHILQLIGQKHQVGEIYLVGGLPRDKVMNKIETPIHDIDLTTGDANIHILASNFASEMRNKFYIKEKQFDDGHYSVNIGKVQFDFSSNFITPGIENILKSKGISNTSNMEKELYSRDFTCNTLIQTLDLRTIKDPTKLGVQDIQNKVLRTCLDPSITLKYNLNRIARIFYLAAKLDFTVEPSIIKWVSQNKQLIHQIKPGYLAKTMAKAFHYNADKTNQLIEQMGIGDILKPQAKTASLVFRKNFDYGDRTELLKKRLEMFKKTLPHIVAYFAGHDDPFNEYMPDGLDIQYYPGRTDDEQAIGEDTLSAGSKDRENSIPGELEGFRKDRKKRLKRIKLRKILEEMGVEMPDEQSDDLLLEGQPYSDNAFNQGVSGLFSYPLSYTGTVVDNLNTTEDKYSKTYQRTD